VSEAIRTRLPQRTLHHLAKDPHHFIHRVHRRSQRGSIRNTRFAAAHHRHHPVPRPEGVLAVRHAGPRIASVMMASFSYPLLRYASRNISRMRSNILYFLDNYNKR
jgi:hypothetical protein